MYAMTAMGVYSRVEELQSRLVSDQHGDWAVRLGRAMRAGATSGEILTDLAIVLDELKNREWLDPDLRSDVGRLLDEIDRSLHPPAWIWDPQSSRYEPPGVASTLEFGYALAGQGWAEAYISDGRTWLRPTASYLSDALRALSDAVDAVVRGRDRVACIWEEEPGNFIWLFEARDESVAVEIYWNAHGASSEWIASGNRSEDNFNVAFEPPAMRVPGEVQGRFSTTRRDLGNAVLKALDKLFSDVGDQGYANRWGAHPFPHREQESLREALGLR